MLIVLEIYRTSFAKIRNITTTLSAIKKVKIFIHFYTFYFSKLVMNN